MQKEEKNGVGAMGKHGDITEKILEAFYKVYNTLGYGFLKKVYHNAMLIQLRKMGLKAEPWVPIKVYFDGHEVGDFSPDILVEDCVMVELKAIKALTDEEHAQLLNYLRATDVEVGLLLNFGPRPEAKRKIFDNINKRPPGEDPF